MQIKKYGGRDIQGTRLCEHFTFGKTSDTYSPRVLGASEISVLFFVVSAGKKPPTLTGSVGPTSVHNQFVGSNSVQLFGKLFFLPSCRPEPQFAIVLRNSHSQQTTRGYRYVRPPFAKSSFSSTECSTFCHVFGPKRANNGELKVDILLQVLP